MKRAEWMSLALIGISAGIAGCRSLRAPLTSDMPSATGREVALAQYAAPLPEAAAEQAPEPGAPPEPLPPPTFAPVPQDMMLPPPVRDSSAEADAAPASITLEQVTTSVYYAYPGLEAAMRELEAKGVQFKTWNKPFLDAYNKAWQEVAAEQAQKSPEFKEAWDSLNKVRADYSIWRERGYLR